jgi:predicted PolB exonuclease-like 3'-5' exonuclease
MPAYLAFDLETVVDAELARRAWGLTGTDREVRAAARARQLEKTQGRSDFLKPLFHRIVALGMAAWSPVTGARKVNAWAGHGEAEMLDLFLAALTDHPVLVSWNGRGFDVPVVMHRALLHQVATATLYGAANGKGWEKYHYRYDGPHLDVADALTGFGNAGMATLEEMALACGLPGKQDVSGADVEALYETEQWDGLRTYVSSDASQTLDLALRLERCRGRATPPAQLALAGTA